MATLSELYITMENLHKLNLPVDERLKQEAAKLNDKSESDNESEQSEGPNLFNL